MKLYMIGLGRMGSGMARRLLSKGHRVIGYDANSEVRKKARAYMEVLESLEELESNEEKLLWLMVPHYVVDLILEELKPYLREGDVVVDGGNSHYRDSQRRYEELKVIGVTS